MNKLTTAIYGALLALGMSSATFAQPGQQGGQPPQNNPQFQQQEQQTDFSDSELESYVAVQSDLQEIRAEYSGKLQETDDPQEAASLQQEASEHMVEAVQEEGLDVETYNQIAVALQSDEELRGRVEEML